MDQPLNRAPAAAPEVSTCGFAVIWQKMVPNRRRKCGCGRNRSPRLWRLVSVRRGGFEQRPRRGSRL